MEMAAENADDGSMVGCSKSVPLRIRVLCWLVKNAGYVTRRNDGTVNRRLANLIDRKVSADQTPRHGVYTKDIVIDKTTGVRVRLFVPDNGANGDFPVVVYFHGGAFCALSAADVAYDTFCRKLAGRLTVAVVSVDYRLAPEHKCPAAYDDCFVALAWLRAQGRDCLPPSADLSRCFLMGDSAGGNIVHHVGCRVAREADMSPIKIAGHVLVQPYFGGEERTPAEVRLSNGVPLITVEAADWYWKAFLPEGATRDHPAANVTSTDISGLSLPPSLVVVGGLDLLQDWQLRYAEHLKKMGKQAEILFYEDAIHAFHVFPGYDLTPRFLRDLAHFLQVRADL
jgi:gibberellin receptor GID1